MSHGMRPVHFTQFCRPWPNGSTIPAMPWLVLGETTKMDTRELIKELVGNVCRCGKQKQQGQTFCRSCYYSLPKPLRTRLYQRIGEGYEEAYQEAIQALQPLPSSPREVMPE